MSLYKRGKTWWIRFTAPNGERVRTSAGTEDRIQAQEYHDRLRAKYWEVQKLGEKPERTWQEAAVRWLKETNHKASHGRDKEILRWLNPYLGDKRLCEINRELLAEVGNTKAAQTSSSTANRYLALVRAIFRKAQKEWEWINTVPRVRMFPQPKRRVRWITQEQAQTLLSHLPPHQAAMARFALATGLRQRNVSLLEWSQIDMERKIAWIHPDQAKARKAIPVALNADAMTVLEHQRRQHPKYVFTYKAKPVWQVNTKSWRKAVKRAGLKDFRWHDLRHTWASWHIQKGTPAYVLQELGGWSSADMVRRYAHLSATHLAEHAERIVSTGTNLTQPPERGETES